MTSSEQASDVRVRSDAWKHIWENKYKVGQGSVHKMDGFDLLSDAEWSRLVTSFSHMLGQLGGADVFEVGCGAGAFLHQLQGPRSLAGIDYAENAIERIRSHLPGRFDCAEAHDIPFADDQFDIVFSFGVFFYFDSLAYAERVVAEMCRIARPGARICIFDVNDAAKIQRYREVRGSEPSREAVKRTDLPANHLFFEKGWFETLGRSLGTNVVIVDEIDLDVAFHSGAEYRFAVQFDVPG